jgi:acetyl-CoA carboxylase carboxyltransferase component
VAEFGGGEELTKEELGGSIPAYLSGAVDNETESEDEACGQIRRFLILPDAKRL